SNEKSLVPSTRRGWRPDTAGSYAGVMAGSYPSAAMRTKRTTRVEFQPPAFSEEEVAAVADVVRSGWLGTGPRVERLEPEASSILGAEHVVGVSSCTVGLQLALLALDVGSGDEVITSAITWPATANAIEACGATPVFCDVRPHDLTIDARLTRELVTERTK